MPTRGRLKIGCRAGALCLALVVLAGCEKKAPPETAARLVLVPVAFADVPGWHGDDVSRAVPALLRSCARLVGAPAARSSGAAADGLAGTVEDWRAPCAALEYLRPGDAAAAREAFEAWFAPFEASSGSGDSGLVTGYYEAEIDGALDPGGAYRIPVYHRPDDLIAVDLGLFAEGLRGRHIVGRVGNGRLTPYHTRAQIDGGVLGSRGLELFWAQDPVDVFFLQIQGSAKVTFPDGSKRRVGFSASNGHGFTAIGRALLDEGKIPPTQASMQGIRAWLRANPEEAEQIMWRNARYIFFRWIDGDGPVGAQGVALTARRSLAVDSRFLPYGTLVFLDTTWPGGGRPLRRLMVAQDTGAAIKGPLRADFYWGAGEPALAEAGRMKERARFYILLPRTVAARRAATS